MQITIPSQVQIAFIRYLMDACMELLCRPNIKNSMIGKNYSKTLKFIGKLLNTLDKKYPRATEDSLSHYLLLTPSSTTIRNYLRSEFVHPSGLNQNSIINNIPRGLEKVAAEDDPEVVLKVATETLVKMITSPKYTLMEESNNTLYLSLNHPTPKIRLIAVQSLVRTFHQTKQLYLETKEISEKQLKFFIFVRQTIESKLMYEQEAVVLFELLNSFGLADLQILYSKEFTTEIDSSSKSNNTTDLLNVLLNFLRNLNITKENEKLWNKMCRKVLVLISDLYTVDQKEGDDQAADFFRMIFTTLLPHLFVTGPKNFYFVRRFTVTSIYKNARAFQILRNSEWETLLANKYKIEQANALLVESFSRELANDLNLFKGLIERANEIIKKSNKDTSKVDDKNNSISSTLRATDKIFLYLTCEILKNQFHCSSLVLGITNEMIVLCFATFFSTLTDRLQPEYFDYIARVHREDGEEAWTDKLYDYVFDDSESADHQNRKQHLNLDELNRLLFPYTKNINTNRNEEKSRLLLLVKSNAPQEHVAAYDFYLLAACYVSCLKIFIQAYRSTLFSAVTPIGNTDTEHENVEIRYSYFFYLEKCVLATLQAPRRQQQFQLVENLFLILSENFKFLMLKCALERVNIDKYNNSLGHDDLVKSGRGGPFWDRMIKGIFVKEFVRAPPLNDTEEESDMMYNNTLNPFQIFLTSFAFSLDFNDTRQSSYQESLGQPPLNQLYRGFIYKLVLWIKKGNNKDGNYSYYSQRNSNIAVPADRDTGADDFDDNNSFLDYIIYNTLTMKNDESARLDAVDFAKTLLYETTIGDKKQQPHPQRPPSLMNNLRKALELSLKLSGTSKLIASQIDTRLSMEFLDIYLLPNLKSITNALCSSSSNLSSSNSSPVFSSWNAEKPLEILLRLFKYYFESALEIICPNLPDTSSHLSSLTEGVVKSLFESFFSKASHHDDASLRESSAVGTFSSLYKNTHVARFCQILCTTLLSHSDRIFHPELTTSQCKRDQIYLFHWIYQYVVITSNNSTSPQQQNSINLLLSNGTTNTNTKPLLGKIVLQQPHLLLNIYKPLILNVFTKKMVSSSTSATQQSSPLAAIKTLRKRNNKKSSASLSPTKTDDFIKLDNLVMPVFDSSLDDIDIPSSLMKINRFRDNSLNELIELVEILNSQSFTDDENYSHSFILTTIHQYVNICLPLCFLILDCYLKYKSQIDRDDAGGHVLDENLLNYLVSSTLSQILHQLNFVSQINNNNLKRINFTSIDKNNTLQNRLEEQKQLSDKLSETVRIHFKTETILKLLSGSSTYPTVTGSLDNNDVKPESAAHLCTKQRNLFNVTAIQILGLAVPVFQDETLLHHVISLFTFMRHPSLIEESSADNSCSIENIPRDDETTFELIYLVLENLIPALIKHSSTKVDVKILEYLIVFSDTALHLPSHRRVPLYKRLIEILVSVKAEIIFNSDKSNLPISRHMVKEFVKKIVLDFLVVLYSSCPGGDQVADTKLDEIAKAIIKITNYEIKLSSSTLSVHVDRNEIILGISEHVNFLIAATVASNAPPSESCHHQVGPAVNNSSLKIHLQNFISATTLQLQRQRSKDKADQDIEQSSLNHYYSLRQYEFSDTLLSTFQTYLQTGLFNIKKQLKRITIGKDDGVLENPLMSLTIRMANVLRSTLTDYFTHQQHYQAEFSDIKEKKTPKSSSPLLSKTKTIKNIFKELLNARLVLIPAILSSASMPEADVSESLMGGGGTLPLPNQKQFTSPLLQIQSDLIHSLKIVVNRANFTDTFRNIHSLLVKEKKNSLDILHVNVSNLRLSKALPEHMPALFSALQLQKICFEALNQLLIGRNRKNNGTRNITHSTDELKADLETQKRLENILNYVITLIEWFVNKSSSPDSSIEGGFSADLLAISTSPNVKRRRKAAGSMNNWLSYDRVNDCALAVAQLAVTCYKQMLPMICSQKRSGLGLAGDRGVKERAIGVICECLNTISNQNSGIFPTPDGNNLKCTAELSLDTKFKLSFALAFAETYSYYQFDARVLEVADKAITLTLSLADSYLGIPLHDSQTSFPPQVYVVLQCTMSCYIKYLSAQQCVVHDKAFSAQMNVAPSTINLTVAPHLSRIISQVIKMYTYHHHHYHQDLSNAKIRSTTKGSVPLSFHKIKLTGTERFSTKLTELVALLTLKIRVDPSLYVEQMIRAYEGLLPLKDETDSELAHGMKITTFQTYFTMLHKYLKANNKFHKAFVPPPIKKLKGFPELSNPDLQAPFGGETLKRQLHDAFIHLWIDTSQNYADTFEEAKKINEIIVQPLLAFCVKLSELHLRPFLLQLKEYVMKSFSTLLPPNDIPTIQSNDEGLDCSTNSKALSPISQQQKVSETFENKLVPLQIDAPYRMAFFVQFILGLADQLNLLFSLFFDIVYEPISKILLLRPDSPVNTFLVEGSLKILSLGLSYTNEIKGYVGDPKKATLLKALMNVDSISPSTVMDNIDNQLQLMTTEKYESLCSTLINLLLEYFSLTRVQVARSFDSSNTIQQPGDQNKKIIDILAELNKLHAIEGDWRIFNDLVLKMTHNVDPQQRLLGIQIFTRVFERCGEEYLVLLPEMLSNIAELLEDDVEEVENSCRSLVEIIEKLLGEPLEKYF